LRVAQLKFDELSSSLSGTGLLIPCGPFCIRVRSDLREFQREFYRLYADFPVLDADTYVDFEVGVRSPNPLRRYFRPQVIFTCDGRIPFKPLPLAQAFPTFEWGLNWTIYTHAHDYLVMHAGVVERGGRCLILAADPGSGKSTLSAALAQSGWRLLSDELALIGLVDGLVRPIARPVSLKNASIGVVRSLGPQVVIGSVCPGTAKGDIAHMRAPSPSVLAMSELAKPALLIFPKYGKESALRTTSKGKAHSLGELTRHTFNFAVLAEQGFDALGRLMDQVETYSIEYSSLDQVIPEVERLWERSK